MIFDPDELRILSMSAPIFLKILRDREKRITDRMCGEFRNGKVEQISNLAELCSVRDQLREIITDLRLQDEQ